MSLVINMIIYPNMKKTLLYFFAISIVVLFLFYLTIDGSFTFPFPTKDYIFFAGWLVITLTYFIITLKMSYYRLEKKGLYQKRMTKEYYFQYNDIIYIDEEWSRKNNILVFVTNRGHAIYLILDKKQTLLDEMLKRCPNLTTKEETKMRFPDVKI